MLNGLIFLRLFWKISIYTSKIQNALERTCIHEHFKKKYKYIEQNYNRNQLHVSVYGIYDKESQYSFQNYIVSCYFWTKHACYMHETYCIHQIMLTFNTNFIMHENWNLIYLIKKHNLKQMQSFKFFNNLS